MDVSLLMHVLAKCFRYALDDRPCRFFSANPILGQRIPLLASFKLTYRCNLACRACPFHRRAGEPDGHMGWDTAVRCLHELSRSGCRMIVFEGGEPLLWRDGGRRAA